MRFPAKKIGFLVFNLKKINQNKNTQIMKKILSIGLLSLSILFAGCSNDDKDDNSGSNSISATINGKEWKGTKINSVTLIKVTSEKQQRFDINVQDDSQMLSLACSSDLTTADTMPLKAYKFDEENDIIDALFINTYLIEGNTYTEHFVKTGTITITSMDASKKTVSGTFNFTAEKVGVLQTKIITPEVVEVKNGVFTNVPYKVLTTP